MHFTDSFMLMLAVGLKIALLAFIFQEKLLGVLVKLRASKQSNPFKSIAFSQTQIEEQQNTIITLEDPNHEEIEQTKIDCSEVDSEVDSDHDDSSIIETNVSETSVQTPKLSSQKSVPRQGKKRASLASLAKNIVAVSLLRSNANASAASKSVSPLERLTSSEFEKVNALNDSQYRDFESLVKILPCESQKGDEVLSREYGALALMLPNLDAQMYKSKRGTRMITKYIKFAQRGHQLGPVKSKKRNLLAKLSKINRNILKTRPRAFELYAI